MFFGRKKSQSEKQSLENAEIGKPKIKITTKNDAYWQFSWIVEIKNKGSEQLNIGALTIKFVDRKGFVLHEELIEAFLAISKRSKHEFKGISMIEPGLARKVDKAEVVLRAV